MYGNISELGDVSGGPGKSYLFFLTAYYPGISLPGDRVALAGKAPHVLRCLVPLRWPVKIRGRDLFAPLVVLITASGLQGEQPLVDRTM